MNICFIDDCFADNGNKARVVQINLLDGYTDLKSHKVLPSAFREWSNSSPPEMDVIFIDFKLNEDRDAKAIFNIGPEIVSLVRAQFPDTPLYLLSVKIDKHSEYERAEGFERQIGENYLSRTESAYADLTDHATLKSVITDKKIDNLIEHLLNTPEDVREDLKKSLPGSVRKYFSSSPKNADGAEKPNIGPRVEFYRWFIDYFYKYPGFLLSEDACALYLGISVDYFKSISNRFDEALYSGLFSKTFEPRWWKSKIEDLIILWDEHDLLNSGSFSEASAKVLSAPSDSLAVCVHCGAYRPEELALTEDTTDSTLVMVHTRCSRRDEDFNAGPYFHKPRIVETQ